MPVVLQPDHAAHSSRNPPLLVLDTNVALDWLVFEDPSVADLARAIEAREVCLVSCAECREELRSVLAYPIFGLGEAERSDALARYAAVAVLLELPGESAKLPLCTDPDDQKFLELAWHAGAGFLVTKDKALLAMARRIHRLGRLRIVAPGAMPGARGVTPP